MVAAEFISAILFILQNKANDLFDELVDLFSQSEFTLRLFGRITTDPFDALLKIHLLEWLLEAHLVLGKAGTFSADPFHEELKIFLFHELHPAQVLVALFLDEFSACLHILLPQGV